MGAKGTKKLHDLDMDAYLVDCTTIYPETLQEEYVRLPADLAYWSARFADALREFLRLKLKADRMEAQVRIEHRERLSTGGGKVTESMVDAAVETDPRLHEAQDAALVAECEKVRLYGVLDSIRAKRDMLQSLGAQVRAEMEHDPITRARVADRRATEGL